MRQNVHNRPATFFRGARPLDLVAGERLGQDSADTPMASPKRRAASKVSPYLRWPPEM
jgi:hypothetical protein